MPNVAALRGVPVVLQPAGSTIGNGLAVAVVTQGKYHEFVVQGTGTITGGTIILEEADNPSYTGTWSQIASITATTVTAGAESVTHVTGMLQAVRARISVAIAGGGSVLVTYNGY
jgi:hypothetical protein